MPVGLADWYSSGLLVDVLEVYRSRTRRFVAVYIPILILQK